MALFFDIPKKLLVNVSGLVDYCKIYIQTTSGQFSLVFALVAMLLLTGVGVAIDFTAQTRAAGRLQDTADAAVLVAVKRTSEEIVKGTPQGLAKQNGEMAGILYISDMVASMGLNSSNTDLNIQVSNGTVTGDLIVSAEMKPLIMGALGYTGLPVSVNASATNGEPSGFSEIHFVVDVSNSMGVGTTQADMSILESSIGCAFACHSPHPALGNTLNAARASGAELRIDTVKNSISDIVNDLNGAGPNLKFAIHTFSNTLSTHLAPTSDIVSVQESINNIDIFGHFGEGGTNIRTSLGNLSNVIGVSGLGQSSFSPKKHVVLITDGVVTNTRYAPDPIYREADPTFVAFPPIYNGTGSSEWSLQGFDGSYCQTAVSETGAEFYTILVEYLVPNGAAAASDLRFWEIEQYLKGDIESNVGNCTSSPDNLFVARYGNEIEVAFSKLFPDLRNSVLRISR